MAPRKKHTGQQETNFSLFFPPWRWCSTAVLSFRSPNPNQFALAPILGIRFFFALGSRLLQVPDHSALELRRRATHPPLTRSAFNFFLLNSIPAMVALVLSPFVGYMVLCGVF